MKPLPESIRRPYFHLARSLAYSPSNTPLAVFPQPAARVHIAVDRHTTHAQLPAQLRHRRISARHRRLREPHVRRRRPQRPARRAAGRGTGSRPPWRRGRTRSACLFLKRWFEIRVAQTRFGRDSTYRKPFRKQRSTNGLIGAATGVTMLGLQIKQTYLDRYNPAGLRYESRRLDSAAILRTESRSENNALQTV